MASSPLISSSNVRSSFASAFGRTTPSAFLKYDSEGRSASLRSSARCRDCLADSISCVAARPVCFRVRAVSGTGGVRVKKFCHGELTLAKPERRAIKEIPMTPTRSRHASLKDWVGDSCGLRPRMVAPLHQKAKSHNVVKKTWNTHASRRIPLLTPV